MGDVEEIQGYLGDIIGDRVEFFLGMRSDESLGEKLSVTIIATGIDDNISGGGFVPRSVPAQPRYGTVNIPSVDSISFNPSPAPAPSPVSRESSERPATPIRTVNPTALGADGTGLKSRVKDVHMEVPSFLRKKNDE